MERTVLKFGVIGEFEEGRESHRALVAALAHSARKLGHSVEVTWLDTNALPQMIDEGGLAKFDGLWVAPGAPYKSTDGALAGIRWARENGTPFIGTCQGFQHAALEYAVSMRGYRFRKNWETDGEVLQPLLCIPYDSTSEFSIRGKDNILFRAYGQSRFSERFRCR